MPWLSCSPVMADCCKLLCMSNRVLRPELIEIALHSKQCKHTPAVAGDNSYT